MSRTAPPSDWKTRAQAFGQQLWATYGQARWQGLSAHERLLASVLVGLFTVWLFVSIAISPALRTLNSAERQRADVAQQVVQMRSLQQRAQELQKPNLFRVMNRSEACKASRQLATLPYK